MATLTHSTPSRRALFGAGAATLLLAAPAAGNAKARELDGELIDACERFEWLEAEVRRRGLAGDESGADRLATIRQQLGWRIAETRARTPEGIQAKARAAHVWIAGEQQHDVGQGLQHSILRDLVGELAGSAAA